METRNVSACNMVNLWRRNIRSKTEERYKKVKNVAKAMQLGLHRVCWRHSETWVWHNDRLLLCSMSRTESMLGVLDFTILRVILSHANMKRSQRSRSNPQLHTEPFNYPRYTNTNPPRTCDNFNRQCQHQFLLQSFYKQMRQEVCFGLYWCT